MDSSLSGKETLNWDLVKKNKGYVKTKSLMTLTKPVIFAMTVKFGGYLKKFKIYFSNYY